MTNPCFKIFQHNWIRLPSTADAEIFEYLTHVVDRVCDCHDMFPTCLAMTKSKRNIHKEIVNTRNFSPLCHCKKLFFCHCEERSDAAVSSTSTYILIFVFAFY